ncbi:DNA methylase (site-specific DNA-methyltransferase adenine-specific, Putative type III restriction-modification system) [Propionibacterium freudenreichii]|uniref:site-specific DNA-methyltransferase n=1 Tax=Propionibacterium freudenreichii TaxID=1744 RepID=UPI00054366D6|nr:site-specific DNA-methyltransferase [Propionibacterium freudenreichii]MCT2973793.1 site-specific DNA-methyltransferase [Propionibacterium freudenreichii]MDK9319117.1 site-specific DNA-methyltransferase [Propionibacterium freudenreichii]CEH03598.1 DNA methylase (site-specific DNA-methyltransferase adenine-specific, Putative type III restriction-modification system) [Propionibacterium freudenreichii]CEH07866.1 DNA methylase (site-specific DNA-methyltransferase adenine-specific, Putative type I
MTAQRLQLTWYNKDKALIPTETGKYGYTWVDPSDPRYCETHTLVMDDYVHGSQTPKSDEFEYSERADLEPPEDNLLILGESGDVLEALTRVPELAEKYVGKVRLIYIDPPFNTAQTFASYEDNLEHSIWLTMMRDRLLHMKKLLTDDGSIWVHLDNVEVHRMRLLMDAIFGPGNFLAEVVWQKADSPRGDAQGFSSDHDTILVYGRSSTPHLNRMARTASDNSRFSNPDNDPQGIWFSDNRSAPANIGNRKQHPSTFGIQHPITGDILYPAIGGCWRFGIERLLPALREFADYEVVPPDLDLRLNRTNLHSSQLREDVGDVMIRGGASAPSQQRARARIKALQWPEFFVTESSFGRKAYPPEQGQPPRTWWDNEEVGHNRQAKAEQKALSTGGTTFSTPKPERLLERVIHIGSDPGDIVLDVFAGSGTTAAVAQKMGRRWLTCELLESTFSTFTRPRLAKVVNDQDPGGVTSTMGERVADSEGGLPDGVSPDDATKFTSVLNKLISDDAAAKKSALVKQLKAAAKTTRTKDVINWRGGGGFQVAHLSPACFDYDETLNRVMLTPEATGQVLIESVAANLGFTLLHPDDDYVFDGRRGNALLKVVEGVATVEQVDWLVSQIETGETIVLAATSVMDGVREHLRRSCKGSRVVAVPDDVFRYTQGGDL